MFACSTEHLLVDNDAVAAVIDFGDVGWGDPDYDSMYLLIDTGGAFLDEIARRYEHPNRDALRAKLRYFGLVDPIDTILNGAGYALAGQEDAAWRRLV